MKLDTTDMLAIGAIALCVVGFVVGYNMNESYKDEKKAKHDDAHMNHVNAKWDELEEAGGFLTDAVPALHAEMDAYIREAEFFNEELREACHNLNARKLSLNSPI